MARKQQSKPPIAPPGAGLLNIAPSAGAQRGGPVTTTVRGKAADAFQKMQQQAVKRGGKTTGPAAAAMLSAMQRQTKQQQTKKGGR